MIPVAGPGWELAPGILPGARFISVCHHYRLFPPVGSRLAQHPSNVRSISPDPEESLFLLVTRSEGADRCRDRLGSQGCAEINTQASFQRADGPERLWNPSLNLSTAS